MIIPPAADICTSQEEPFSLSVGLPQRMACTSMLWSEGPPSAELPSACPRGSACPGAIVVQITNPIKSDFAAWGRVALKPSCGGMHARGDRSSTRACDLRWRPLDCNDRAKAFFGPRTSHQGPVLGQAWPLLNSPLLLSSLSSLSRWIAGPCNIIALKLAIVMQKGRWGFLGRSWGLGRRRMWHVVATRHMPLALGSASAMQHRAI